MCTRYKRPQTNCHFWVSRSKQGWYCHDPCIQPYLWVSKPLGYPSNLTHRYAPTFTPFKEPACPSSESNQGHLLLVLTPPIAAWVLIKPCLNFSIWPHQFILIKESKDPDHINIALKCYELKWTEEWILEISPNCMRLQDRKDCKNNRPSFCSSVQSHSLSKNKW